jgi:hypothetical protein
MASVNEGHRGRERTVLVRACKMNQQDLCDILVTEAARDRLQPQACKVTSEHFRAGTCR